MNDVQRLFNSFEGESDTYREVRKEEKQDTNRHTWSLLEGINRLSGKRKDAVPESSVRPRAARMKPDSPVAGDQTAPLDEKTPEKNLLKEGVCAIAPPKKAATVPLDHRVGASPIPTAPDAKTDDSLDSVFKRLKKNPSTTAEPSLLSTFQKLVK